MAKTTVIGSRALRASLRDLADFAATRDIAGRRAASRVFNQIIGDAATTLRDQARSNARSQGLDAAIIKSIFRSSDEAKEVSGLLPGQARRATAGLVGVRTGAPPRRDPKLYLTWKAGGGSKNPRAKSAKGRIIGSSRAALYERGYYTKSGRLIHKPFFRPAVQAVRAKLTAEMVRRLKALVESFSDAN